MSGSFHIDSLKILLSHLKLMPQERNLLQALLGAAVMGNYWDELYRMAVRDPDLPFVLKNVVSKARAAGLTPAFQFLKEHYRYDQGVEV